LTENPYANKIWAIGFRGETLMKFLKPFAVPAGAFLLAVTISLISGPKSRAFTLRHPAEETGKCSCQLKVLDMKCNVDWNINEIGEEKSPFINTIKVHIEGKICQERTSSSPPNNIMTDAVVELLVGALLKCNGKPDSDEKNLQLVVKPQKVDVLTCPGKNYAYTWDGDQDSLRLAAFEKFGQLLKIEKKNCEVLDVFLQLQGAGKDLDYLVKTETHCDGPLLLDSCKDKVELRQKKGVLSGSNSHSKTCSIFVCRFGSP
jgi:hypothetical protein